MGLGAALMASSAIQGGLGYAGAKSASGSSKDAILASMWAENQNRKRRAKTLEPLTRVGIDSVRRIQNGIDLDPAQLENDPFYQFQFQQGLDAVQGSAAARGMLDSGRALKELMGYGQGMASSQLDKGYNREMNRLQYLAGLGSNALGQVAGGGSIVPQVAANAMNNQGMYSIMGSQAGADALSGIVQGGMIGASGASLKDLLGLPTSGATNWGIYG